MDPDIDAYEERLAVPASWWLIGAALVVSVGWVFFVATPLDVTVVAGVVAAGIVFGGLERYGAPRVATDPDGFSAGRALLPYRHAGNVEALDAAATRRVLGVEADARAHLLVRAYCGGAVKVTLEDRADPTPYWLVSTRHPAALAASLAAHTMQD
ncbi:MAG: DUF3093 domain-containing protein [Nocardioidaceae bacterium]